MTNNTLQELLPCPFCGAAAYIEQGKSEPCQLHGDRVPTFRVIAMHTDPKFSNESNVKRRDCPVRPSVTRYSREDAIAAWNTRAQPAPAAGVVELRGLVARGLNLCAQGRNLNKKIDEAPPQHCATPYVWAQEQYEEQLAQWERDASNTLAALPAPSVGEKLTEDEIALMMYNQIAKVDREDFCDDSGPYDVYDDRQHQIECMRAAYRALIAAGVIMGV